LSGFLIVGIDHSQAASAGKQLWLEPDSDSPTGDRLAIEFALTAEEQARYDEREKAFLHILRRIGAWPLKRVRPPLGASIHYGGTIPRRDGNAAFSVDETGRLSGSHSVFVADGSSFTFLPAKGVTFSLMANAHRVAAALVAPAMP
jgi:choline dehydrogenase-like flavoprotein